MVRPCFFVSLFFSFLPIGLFSSALGQERCGFLDITSNPSEVDIYIDGSYKGKTPLGGIELSPGVHQVRAVKQNYGSTTRTVLIKPDTSQKIVIELIKAKDKTDKTEQIFTIERDMGHLLVISPSPELPVSLDEEIKGKGSLKISGIPTGDHLLRIGTAERLITIHKNYLLRVRITEDLSRIEVLNEKRALEKERMEAKVANLRNSVRKAIESAKVLTPASPSATTAWEKAEEAILELLRLVPEDEQAQEWRQEVKHHQKSVRKLKSITAGPHLVRYLDTGCICEGFLYIGKGQIYTRLWYIVRWNPSAKPKYDRDPSSFCQWSRPVTAVRQLSKTDSRIRVAGVEIWVKEKGDLENVFLSLNGVAQEVVDVMQVLN